VELWEDILEGKKLPKIYYKQDYGAPLFSAMPRIMPEHVMFVRGSVSHCVEMSFHYICLGSSSL
jgi:hypothetical protein